jgi:geranylgeranyl diphosphate synthase, type II
VTADRPEQAEDPPAGRPERPGRAEDPGAGRTGRADRAGDLDRGAGYPEHLRIEVERYLEGMRFSQEALTAGLEEAMRYSLLAGGKRIRPVLALASARAVGLSQHEAMPLAGAIELIHTYSLIHDDLPAMDDDALRRGMPTCHVKYGEDVAILAGDGLYAEAFRHLLAERRSPPERVLEAATELAAATGVNGMVGGQYADVSPDTPDGPTQPSGLGAPLRRVHELKTGRLIDASVVCVLLLGGIEGPATMWYRRFAAELGVLFQIVDDILDVTGTDEALGKPRGSDERHGKRTYVSEFGMEQARRLAAESHRTAREALAQAASTGTGEPNAGVELEQIADFIYTRTS